MNATTTNTQTVKRCSDCNCTRPIEFFCGKRDFYKTCITCRNRRSDVGKAIPNEMLITLDEAIELIPSRYDDDEGTVIDRDSASINYSVDVYIRIDENMAAMDDEQLLTDIRTRVEGRDGYHYYQYFTKDTRLKYGNSFICACSQDYDTQRQVVDDRRKRICTRMDVSLCGGFIKGLIERRFEYVHLTIEHSIGHRAAPDSVNNDVDEDIRVYIQQNCTRMSAQDLYRDILGRFPNVLGSLKQSQVYYWWNQSFEHQYRLHNNQFTSADMLLDQVAGQGIMKVS
ncbi:hypothetical protein BDA99DRAFT_530641 [Phascolomyces articulosus]|uniref:SWIM-type domain-containing protein n=1 Tax=Phascolomyces articulosus TaxID=60185 RepID=A0AAD5JVU2_9FUNG|nr:hypothetical protein BDA99DRAFT_530641 [Phascolomyces articulosus]